MQSKSVRNIIVSSNKLAVLIDEASSLRFSQSNKSPEFTILELVALGNSRVDGICRVHSPV